MAWEHPHLNGWQSCIYPGPLPKSCFMPRHSKALCEANLTVVSPYLYPLCRFQTNVCCIGTSSSDLNGHHVDFHIPVSIFTLPLEMTDTESLNALLSQLIWAMRCMPLSSVHHVSSQMRSRLQSVSGKQWSLLKMVELKCKYCACLRWFKLVPMVFHYPGNIEAKTCGSQKFAELEKLTKLSPFLWCLECKYCELELISQPESLPGNYNDIVDM